MTVQGKYCMTCPRLTSVLFPSFVHHSPVWILLFFDLHFLL